MFSAYLSIFALTDELGHSMRRPAAPSAVVQLEYSRWQCNIADLNRNRSQTALNKIQDLFWQPLDRMCKQRILRNSKSEWLEEGIQ